MSKEVNVIKLGVISYANGLKIQEHYINKLKQNLKTKSRADLIGTLLLLQHKPVYTVGLRSLQEYDQNFEKKLKTLGADFYKTNRGGLVTFHGPGQLVAYPILNLKFLKPSVKWYICNLQKTVIDLCKLEYGLNASIIKEYTGVWIDNDHKICAMGIHSSMYITHHGLALNCDNDLSWFSHIIPCGISNKFVTSLSQHCKQNISVDKVMPQFLKYFQLTFDCKANYKSLDEEIKHFGS